MFVFDMACSKTFEHLKEKLISDLVIVASHWSKVFELMCYASGFLLGAVLGQRCENKFHPVYYTNKALSGAQRNYTMIEQELPVILYAFEKFILYLLGKNVIIHIDHVYFDI